MDVTICNILLETASTILARWMWLVNILVEKGFKTEETGLGTVEPQAT